MSESEEKGRKKESERERERNTATSPSDYGNDEEEVNSARAQSKRHGETPQVHPASSPVKHNGTKNCTALLCWFVTFVSLRAGLYCVLNESCIREDTDEVSRVNVLDFVSTI